VATPTLPSHDPNAFSTIRNALDKIQSKKKYVTKYIYEIEKKTPKEHIVGKLRVTSSRTNTNKTRMCSQNLMSVTHNISDHHLHYE
jgi:hypothetical protein